MRYFIRQGRKYVSGPFDRGQIRTWIREGRVRDDMEFSVDRADWMFGIEMIDLFPRRRPRVSRTPRWTSRGSRS